MRLLECIDVIDGQFRIRCYSKENAQQWVEFVVAKGGVPHVEMSQAAA